MKLVFILVDALKSNYLTEDNMPFLYGLAQKGRYIKEILPSAGFCERSEIFSGLDSFDTGNFTAIGYIPENSVYKKDVFLLTLASVAERISRKLTRYVFSRLRIRLKRTMNMYHVPFQSLSKFALTEDGNAKFIAHDTIFDELKKANKTYTLNAFTSLSDLRTRTMETSVSFVKRNVKEGIDFIPYYIGVIDNVGHRYGGCVEKIKPYLKAVDNELKDLFTMSHESGYTFAVLGDHGMVPIEKKVNIKASIDKLPIKHIRDYEVFFDSTTVRFWFYNENAETVIKKMLIDEYSSFGKIVDKNSYKEYRIPLDIICKSGKPIYGDVVWFANPGVLVSPDYFHKAEDAENGMHGYIDVVYGEGTGLFITVGDNVTPITIQKSYLSSVCAELCNILDITPPNSNKWKRQII